MRIYKGKNKCDSQRKNLKRYYHSFSFSFGVFYWFHGHSMRFHFQIDPKPDNDSKLGKRSNPTAKILIIVTFFIVLP